MFLVKKYLFLIMVSVVNGSLYSQVNLIDSLKHALNNAAHNTPRCNLLNALINAEQNDEIWPVYIEELKKLETELTPNLKTYYLKHHSYEKKELEMKAEQDKKDVISKENLKQKKNNEIILLPVLQ